jgi:hypothetical protein
MFSDTFFQSFGWVALAIGIVAVVALIEVALRTITNRFGTPARTDMHRTIRSN